MLARFSARVGLACALCVACAGTDPAPQHGAARAAIELFELARQEDREEADIARLIDADREARRDAALLDALDGLGRFPAPGESEVHELASPDETAVDLAADLPGGGSARFSVHLRNEDGAWKVTWFQAPGVEWPPRRKGKGESLTSSEP